MRRQENVAKLPYSAQTGWSLRNPVSEYKFRKLFIWCFSHPETCLVSDHAVRSIKGGFAPFFLSRQPLLAEEGNVAGLNPALLTNGRLRGAI